MPSGRKSIKDEIGVLQRYNQLSKKYFDFIEEMLDSKSKIDRKWAAERLDKAFPKMIPTQVGGLDGQPIQVQWQQSPSLILARRWAEKLHDALTRWIVLGQHRRAATT